MTGSRLKGLMLLLLAVTTWCLTGVGKARAGVAGQIIQVEGQADIMKKGQLPVVPLKEGDGVEPGDVIRTKPDSRAKVKFIDGTTLTIGPESRVGIEEFMYDAQKNQRNAVLQVFRGLVHAVVDKVIKVEEPDFVVKTNTAILGVRGTGFFVNLALMYTDLWVELGKVSAKNIFAEVKGEVIAGAMHFVRIGMGLPPTIPLAISEQDIKNLQNRMAPKRGGQAAGGSGSEGASPLASGSGSGDNPPSSPFQTINDTLKTTTTTNDRPLIDPPRERFSPPTPSFSFTQDYAGTYIKTSESPFNQATYFSPSGASGSGVRYSVYPGAFTSNYSLFAVSPQDNTFSAFSTGIFTAHMEGTVRGTLGNPLNGTMTLNGVTAGGTIFNLSGSVTLFPNGNLTFTPQGSFTLGTITGKVDPLSSTWTQTAIVSITGTSVTLGTSAAFVRIRPYLNQPQLASLARIRRQ